MQRRPGAAKQRSGPGSQPAAEQLTVEDEEFRGRIRSWLEVNLSGEFGALRGLGGPGREHEYCERRLAWNRARLARAGGPGALRRGQGRSDGADSSYLTGEVISVSSQHP
jgi:hypothetical protein